ncbi:hypothetical protein IBX65_07145 [Candidatus Aerophobetes bacterium]|nr:hypothetical protein [Candidatus Aerophobetes bacterium]
MEKNILKLIQKCFKEQKVLYTSHAREEMRLEERGIIREEEDDLTIVITAYQPDPRLWIDYKRRREN